MIFLVKFKEKNGQIWVVKNKMEIFQNKVIIKEPNYPQFSSPIIDSPLKTNSLLNAIHHYSDSASQSRSPVIIRKKETSSKKPTSIWKVGSMKNIRMRDKEENIYKVKKSKFGQFLKMRKIQNLKEKVVDKEKENKELVEEVYEKRNISKEEFRVESSITIPIKVDQGEKGEEDRLESSRTEENLREENELTTSIKLNENGKGDSNHSKNKSKENSNKESKSEIESNKKSKISNKNHKENLEEDSYLDPTFKLEQTEESQIIQNKEKQLKTKKKSQKKSAEISSSMDTLNPPNTKPRHIDLKEYFHKFKKVKINSTLFYLGPIKNGLFHGYGKITTYKGQIIYEGYFSEGKYQGNGKLFNFLKKSTEKFKSEIQKNYINLSQNNHREDIRGVKGLLNLNFSNENWEYYEGNFYNGRKHGIGKLVLSDGRIYEGEFIMGFAEGYGILKYYGKTIAGKWEKNILRQFL